MNLLQFSLVLLVLASTTSDVLGGASRGQEQDLRSYLRISCNNDKKEAHGRMNNSKMEARATQGNQEARSKNDKSENLVYIEATLSEEKAGKRRTSRRTRSHLQP
jgi:hypothetical protein